MKRYWIATYDSNVRSIEADTREQAMIRARAARKPGDGMLIRVEEVEDEEGNVYDEPTD